MDKFNQLRAKLKALSMGHGSDRRPGADCILEKTLEELASIESAVHTLCREVASLSIDHHSKAYATTPEFDQMCEALGVQIPEIR